MESFTTILRKLAAEEFASEKLLRQCAIRRQIESLLQSPAELKSLCSALHKELSLLISSLPSGKGRHQFQVKLWPQFQVKLWPQFHIFRIRTYKHTIWNCVFVCSVHMFSQFRLTLYCYDNSGFCYPNECLCCGQFAPQPRLLKCSGTEIVRSCIRISP